MPSKHAAKNRRRLAEQARLAAAVERQAAGPGRKPPIGNMTKAEREAAIRGAIYEACPALMAGEIMLQNQRDHDEVRAEALRRLEANDYGR